MLLLTLLLQKTKKSFDGDEEASTSKKAKTEDSFKPKKAKFDKNKKEPKVGDLSVKSHKKPYKKDLSDKKAFKKDSDGRKPFKKDADGKKTFKFDADGKKKFKEFKNKENKPFVKLNKKAGLH